MIANFNLSQLFTFPVKDEEARRNFLILSLVFFVSFIIPILPLILAIGYTARIMRRVIHGEPPHMAAWDNWEAMLKDGLYLFGVRFVYMIPLFVILIPLTFGMAFIPALAEVNHNASDEILIVSLILFGLAMLVIFPFSLAMGIILPAAESHVVAYGDFAAGFRIREWWSIFRANWTGFLLAYLISIIASMILSTIVGIAMVTIILFCIVPFIMPAITAYLTLVMYAAFAQAYRDGSDSQSKANR